MISKLWLHENPLWWMWWVNRFVCNPYLSSCIEHEFWNEKCSNLKVLSDYLQHHTNWTPTVIIWDFNLSPWSYYYKQFTKHLKLLNALSYQSPSYTRSLLQQWIFRSHIDQLFISPEIKVSPVKIKNLSGSDHRSFSFSVGL